MKKLLSFILLLVFVLNTNAQCSIDYSQFTEVWRDDFDGTMADLEENWRVGEYSFGKIINPGYEVIIDPSIREWVVAKTNKNNVSLSNGYVHLKNSMLPKYEPVNVCKQVAPFVEHCRVHRQKYTTSVIETTIGEIFNKQSCNEEDKKGWLYGMFEVRCKIPSDEMFASAFWMIPANSWPPEVDVFEVDEYCRNNSACPENYDFHTSVGQKAINPDKNIIWHKTYHKAANTNFYDEFHTWTVLWTPDKLKFYLDGNEYRTWYGNVNEDGSSPTCDWRRMRMILSTSNTLHANRIINEHKFNPNTEFLIDWVKVYKPTSGYYFDLDEPNLLSEKMNFEKDDIDGNAQLFNNKIYYRNYVDELSSVFYNTNNTRWEDEEIFNSFNQKIKGDPLIESSSKIYYKDNQNKIKNFYKSSGNWYNAYIDNSQKIKDQFVPTKFGTIGEIIFTDLNRRIKHFYWNGSSWSNQFLFNSNEAGRKANDNFIVTDDLMAYEGRKQIWPYWFRDKYLWVVRKGIDAYGNPYFEKHKFPNKIYTQGTHTKIENFAISEDEKKIFYITENNQLKYHKYNSNTGYWHEDIEVDDYFYNVYDNLEVANNGNQVFYTDNTGHVHNFYKSGGVWYNNTINWNNSLDKDDINLLKYDETTQRLYFTTEYTNPGNLNGWTANGVIRYFEWSSITNTWDYKPIIISNNAAGNTEHEGRVKSQIQLLANGEAIYVDQENNLHKIYKPALCNELIYDSNTFVYGLGTNKTDSENVIENFLDNPNFTSKIGGVEKELSPLKVPTDFNKKKYVASHYDSRGGYRVIESVYPNTTSGVFTIAIKDEALIQNSTAERKVSIVEPITNIVVAQKNINVGQKYINFDIGTDPDGEYGIVIEELGNVDSKMLIKGN